MNNTNDTKYDNRITAMRALAIFSVISAHTAPIHGSADMACITAGRIMQMVGTWGVPIFYIISGYFFDRSEERFAGFFKKKLMNIVIPWIFCYTLLWFYVILRKGGGTFKYWTQFVIGYYSSSYYITMLLVMYLLFWVIRKRYPVILAITVLSGAWTIMYPFSAFMHKVGEIFPNDYLNPLFWMVWFGIGMLLGYGDLYEKMISLCKKGVIPFSALTIAGVCVFAVKEIRYDYFSEYSFFILFISSFMIVGISQLLYDKKPVLFIGENSFSFYLLNQFFSGAVIYVTSLLNSWWVMPIRPVAVTCILVVIMYMIRLLASRSPLWSSLVRVIGCRYEPKRCLR